MELIQTQIQNRFKDLLIVLGASILLTLSAWIAIPLPFTPVPITFTAQLVLFLAVTMGRKGAYATALYIAQGLAGLPVFAKGGATFAHLLGPTGGYIIGFLISACALAYLSERMKNKTPAKLFGLMMLGTAIIYSFGLPHLALFVGAGNAIKLGFAPFLPGGLIKQAIAYRGLKHFC